MAVVTMLTDTQLGQPNGVAQLDANGQLVARQSPAGGLPAYEAVVDAAGNGDYLLPSAAFAAGKTSVLIKNGTYVETADIVLPDGGVIRGESPSGVTIVLGTFQMKIDGSGATKISTGTVTVANNSTAVSGSGTTFTSLPNPATNKVYIQLGVNFYRIASITDNTNLVIVDTYVGDGFAGKNFIAQQMASGIVIENLILANSTIVGLSLKGIFHSKISSILVTNSTGNNIDLIDSSLVHFFGIASQNSAGDGLMITDSYSILVSTSTFNNNLRGLETTGNCTGLVFDGCYCNVNDDDGISIGGTSSQINITDCIFYRNDLKGIDIESTGVTTVVTDSCTVTENALDGIDYDGLNNIVSNCIIKDNGGQGVQGGDNGLISGNFISGNGGNGVNANNDNSCTITGNIIQNNTNGIVIGDINGSIVGNVVRNNSGVGIQLSGALASDNIVSGNRVTGNGGIGIHIDNIGATDNIVTSNNAKGNTGASITDAGTGTVNANNVI